MAWKEENINAYVRDLIRPHLHSSYVAHKPLLSMLMGADKANLDRLGDPKLGMFVGGRNLGIGEKHMLAGSKTHSFRYQKSQTDVATNVQAGAATPTSSGFAEDNVGTAGVNWTHFWNPLKIREDTLNNIQNGSTGHGESGNIQIASVLEEAIAMGFQRALEKQQSQLWAAELSAAQQNFDTQTWVDYIGLRQWCDDGVNDTDHTIVGGVDRTIHTQLKGIVTDVSTVDFGDGNGEVNIRGLRQLRLLPAYGSMRKLRANAGRLIITSPALYEGLANAADLRNQINSNAVREFAETGFKNPYIVVDDMIITWDHDCTATELYMLTPESWVFEIQAGSNFNVEPWTEKWRSEEGGDYYRWTQIHTKSRLICREPWLQHKVVGAVALNA